MSNRGGGEIASVAHMASAGPPSLAITKRGGGRRLDIEGYYNKKVIITKRGGGRRPDRSSGTYGLREGLGLSQVAVTVLSSYRPSPSQIIQRKESESD